MKVKRQRNGTVWTITVRENGHDVIPLLEWTARDTGVRTSRNGNTAWLYVDEEGKEQAAFSLRDIEQAALGRALLLRALSEVSPA